MKATLAMKVMCFITLVSVAFLQCIPSGVSAIAPVVADSASGGGGASVPVKAAETPSQPAPEQAVIPSNPLMNTGGIAKATASITVPVSTQAVSSTNTAQLATANVVAPAAQTQTVAAVAQTVAPVSTPVASSTTSAQLSALPAPAGAIVFPCTLKQYNIGNSLIRVITMDANGNTLSTQVYGNVPATQIPAYVIVVDTTGSTYSVIYYNTAGQVSKTTYYQYNWSSIPLIPAPANSVVFPNTHKEYDANGVLLKEIVMDASGKIYCMTVYGNASPTQLPAKVTVLNSLGAYSDVYYNTAGQVIKTTYYQYKLATYYPNSWVSVPVVPDQTFNGVQFKHYDANGQLFREFVMTGDGKIVSMTLYGNATATQLPAKVAVISTIVGRLDNEIYYDASGQVIKTTYYSFVYGAIPFPLEAGYWGYASTSPNTRMEYDANGTLFAEIVMSGGTVYYQDPSRNMVSVTLYGNATFTQPPAKVVVKTSTGAIYSEIYCSPTGQVTKTTFYPVYPSKSINVPMAPNPVSPPMIYPNTRVEYDAQGNLSREFVFDASGNAVSMSIYGNSAATVTNLPAIAQVKTSTGALYCVIYYNTSGQIWQTTYFQYNWSSLPQLLVAPASGAWTFSSPLSPSPRSRSGMLKYYTANGQPLYDFQVSAGSIISMTVYGTSSLTQIPYSGMAIDNKGRISATLVYDATNGKFVAVPVL